MKVQQPLLEPTIIGIDVLDVIPENKSAVQRNFPVEWQVPHPFLPSTGYELNGRIGRGLVIRQVVGMAAEL